MKKLIDEESVHALMTAGTFLCAIVYFALLGFLWGVLLLFWLVMLFFVLPLVWKQHSTKGERIAIILLVLLWLLAMLKALVQYLLG